MSDLSIPRVKYRLDLAAFDPLRSSADRMHSWRPPPPARLNAREPFHCENYFVNPHKFFTKFPDKVRDIHWSSYFKSWKRRTH